MIMVHKKVKFFTLNLNDDYEGGLFDLSIPSPKKDDIKHTQ